MLVREDREESLICRTNDAFERFNREAVVQFEVASSAMEIQDLKLRARLNLYG